MEFENLAKQYLTHLIKLECWDSMDVKGRSIEVTQSFYRILVVMCLMYHAVRTFFIGL